MWTPTPWVYPVALEFGTAGWCGWWSWRRPQGLVSRQLGPGGCMPPSILHLSSLLPAEAKLWIRILCQSLLSSPGPFWPRLGLQVTHMPTHPSLYIPQPLHHHYSRCLLHLLSRGNSAPLQAPPLEWGQGHWRLVPKGCVGARQTSWWKNPWICSPTQP